MRKSDAHRWHVNLWGGLEMNGLLVINGVFVGIVSSWCLTNVYDQNVTILVPIPKSNVFQWLILRTTDAQSRNHPQHLFSISWACCCVERHKVMMMIMSHGSSLSFPLGWSPSAWNVKKKSVFFFFCEVGGKWTHTLSHTDNHWIDKYSEDRGGRDEQDEGRERRKWRRNVRKRERKRDS